MCKIVLKLCVFDFTPDFIVHAWKKGFEISRFTSKSILFTSSSLKFEIQNLGIKVKSPFENNSEKFGNDILLQISGTFQRTILIC